MARDKEAVIWTRLSGKPVKMGRLYLTESECRFTYELDYLTLQQPGLGLQPGLPYPRLSVTPY